MRINQAKIASELGVSVITVSRALRNHPDLAEATKERILEKARELGYARLRAPKPAAALRRAGVLFFDDDPRADPLASGVRRQIFFGLHQRCKALNTETLIEVPSSSEIPLVVKNRTVEAVFLFGRYSAETVQRLGDTPALAVSSYSQDISIPRIAADNFHGMKEATEHLIKLGHRRILFVHMDDPRTQIFAERKRGYLWAMQQNGLTPEPFLWGSETGPAPQRFDDFPKGIALAFASDSLAGSALEHLESKGWRLPQDCSAVSFDDILPASRGLTSFAPDWALMGKLAADLLLAWPDFPRRTPIAVTVPGHLAIRSSAISA